MFRTVGGNPKCVQSGGLRVPLRKVCLCTCVKTACFPTDEKPFFEAAADGPARKMTRLRLRARLRAPRRVEARAPDPPLPPGRGQVGQTAKVSGEGEADEQPSSGISGQTHELRPEVMKERSPLESYRYVFDVGRLLYIFTSKIGTTMPFSASVRTAPKSNVFVTLPLQNTSTSRSSSSAPCPSVSVVIFPF
ncbi:unnamed protein product [Prorocentrum cordatum]|uniref:Uncharacterized protein n=2 Tax=Prorocentrum cordatum TaxID=2364126 RepID=A0ABN9S8T0_9DINO|nr:unnamed protein product [Polarella glacialis]